MNTISIVTPSLNQEEQFIEQTIKSVLSQKGNFYIDYIIADGGSTNNSMNVVKKYDQLLKNNQYPVKCKGITFRWWSRPDNGQSSAINQGFKIARGGILTWLCADDYYEPGALDYIIKKFREHPEADLIYGHCFAIYQKSGKKKILLAKQGDFETSLRRNKGICQPAAFFTKKIIERVGYLDENLYHVFDYDLWLRILKISRGVCVNKTLANFRFWEKALSIAFPKRMAKERKILFKRYGGNIIDPKTIYKIRGKIPFFAFLREKTPRFYNLGKKIFYFFVDKLRYRKPERNL